MTQLLGLYPEELKALMGELGQPAFRAAQLFRALHQGQRPAEISTLPKALREALLQDHSLGGVEIQESYVSKRDPPGSATKKYLFLLEDGHIIEGVLMAYHHGYTLCISSQVGCRMGCRFCASTLEGLARNLSAGEMLAQVLAVNRAQPEGERVGNVVVMGSGEPLDNYEELLRFLRLLSHPDGLQMSLRHVSVSTCGLVPRIRELAEERLGITLCISLHAPVDELRAELMPIAKSHPLSELMPACREYVAKTGRRIIFEYALMEGVNDSLEMANRLAGLVRGLQCHINLIPMNPVSERTLRGSPELQVAAFQNRLEERHISVTRRRTMGSDIEGACGQLRRSYLAQKPL